MTRVRSGCAVRDFSSGTTGQSRFKTVADSALAILSLPDAEIFWSIHPYCLNKAVYEFFVNFRISLQVKKKG